MEVFGLNKEIFLAAIAYLALTLVLTFPLILDASSSLYSFPGDNLFGIQLVWWYKYSLQQGLDFGNFSYFSAPFGSNLATFPFPPYITYLAGVIAIPASPVFGYNFVILLGIFLSGISFFLLGKHLTRNPYAAFFLGFVGLMVSLRVSLGNPEMAQLQWVAFCALFLFRFWETKRIREVAAAAVFFLLAVLSFYYFAAILGLFVLCFLIVKFSSALYRKEKLGASAYTGTILFFAISFAVLAPFVLPLLPNVFSPTSVYELSESRTALPLEAWSVLLPPPYHPIFGESVQDLMVFFGGRVTSNALEKGKFLGYSLIALSIAGAWLFFKKRFDKKVAENVFLFLVCFFVSLFLAVQPPFFSFFRTVARFQTIMLFSLACISCYAISHYLSRIESNKKKLLITFIICAIVFIEFMPPIFNSTSLEPVPESYRWLSQQPGDFIIAEYYPKEEISSDLWNSTISYFQTVHQKKLFPIMEISMQSEEANIAYRKAKNIESEEAGKVLAQYGVKYVLIHKGKYFSVPKYILGGNDRIKPINLEKIPSNLALVQDFEDAFVFGVKD